MFLVVLLFCDFFILTPGDISFAIFRSGSTPDGLSLKIDGSIDLDQTWRYSGVKDVGPALRVGDVLDDSVTADRNKFRASSDAPEETWHKVKDVDKIKDFTVHVYKQSMKVFDSIKKKITHQDIKDKVDMLSKSYKEKFTDFVQDTRETDIRTRSGDQKVILHTIDTSNLILQRLVNFLKVDMAKLGIAGVGEKNLQKEVDTEKELEYKHVCAKYGYCRSSNGFSAMLQKVIRILLSVPNDKLRQATDAITEVFKNSNYSRLLDVKTDAAFKQSIDKLEKAEPSKTRQILSVLLGVLSKSESPMVVEDSSSPQVKKTAAFYQLMDSMDKAMPADETNRLEWNDLINMLTEWKDGERSDILEIMQALDANIKKGIDKMDDASVEKMKQQIKNMQS